MSLHLAGDALDDGERLLIAVASCLAQKVNSDDKFRRWLELSSCLREISAEVYQRLERASNDAQLVAALTFVRASESFEAAVHLLEAGFIVDARTVIRSAAEATIALGALEEDPKFVDRMVAAEQLRKLKLARLILSDAKLREATSPETRKRLEDAIAEIMADGTEPKGIIWEQVAKGVYKEFYNVIYRQMSGDGTHVTLEALNRHAASDENLRISGLRFGPVDDDWDNTMHGACTAFLNALRAVVSIFGIEEMSDDVGRRLRPFMDLLGGVLE